MVEEFLVKFLGERFVMFLFFCAATIFFAVIFGSAMGAGKK